MATTGTDLYWHPMGSPCLRHHDLPPRRLVDLLRWRKADIQATAILNLFVFRTKRWSSFADGDTKCHLPIIGHGFFTGPVPFLRLLLQDLFRKMFPGAPPGPVAVGAHNT